MAVTDLKAYPTPSTSNPEYLIPFVDPVFGGQIIRVTDPDKSIKGLGGLMWRTKARHGYSSRQPWNADETLLAVGPRGATAGGYVFLDGRTYEPLFHRKPGAVLWHPTDPELMITANSEGIWTYEPRRDRTTMKVDLSIDRQGWPSRKGGPGLWGSSDYNLTHDGSSLVVAGRRKSDGKWIAFAVNWQTGERWGELDLKAIRDSRASSDHIIEVTISPSGKYLRAYGRLIGFQDSRGQAQAGYDAGSNQLWLAPNYHEGHHGDFLVDESGEDCHAGVYKGRSGDYLHGHIIKRRMRDGDVTSLLPYWGSHTGCRNIGRPSIAFVSYHSPTKGNLQNEIVGIHTDGSQQIERYGHSHRVADGYSSETHASPSPSGTRAIFASNWGKKGPIASYVVEHGETPAPAPEPKDFDLMMSLQSNRSDAELLHEQIVSGKIHVFVVPEDAAKVEFWIDSRQGAPHQTESRAPFDLCGSNKDGTAKPLDTLLLPDGEHTIIADVTYGDGQLLTIGGSFEVDNQVEPPADVTWEGELRSSDGQSINLKGVEGD